MIASVFLPLTKADWTTKISNFKTYLANLPANTKNAIIQIRSKIASKLKFTGNENKNLCYVASSGNVQPIGYFNSDGKFIVAQNKWSDDIPESYSLYQEIDEVSFKKNANAQSEIGDLGVYVDGNGGVKVGRKVFSLAEGGSFAKLSTKSSLSNSLFHDLENVLASAPSIKFNYGSKTLQTPKQFLNAIGNDMYDIIFSNGDYAKFDSATGRMLYSDGANQYFIRYVSGNNVEDVEELITTRIEQLRNCLGLNGNQTIQLEFGLGTVTTDPNKVTTFIGKTEQTQILKNQFGDFKHIEVGETAGSVNLLNMPDTYFYGPTWWIDHNKAWIERAITRRDNIYIASPLSDIDMSTDNILVSQQYGPSYYANELYALVKADYKPVNLTNSEWVDVKNLINSIFE